MLRAVAELRKRAAIVSQQEIAIAKWQAKCKTLDCKLRLQKEQEKKAKEEAKEAEAGGLAASLRANAAATAVRSPIIRSPKSPLQDSDSANCLTVSASRQQAAADRPRIRAQEGRPGSGGNVGRYKEKLRATKQALKFITEELEAREVEVVRPHGTSLAVVGPCSSAW